MNERDPWIIRTRAMHVGHKATLLKPRRTWVRKRLKYQIVAVVSSTFIDSERTVIDRLLRRVPADIEVDVEREDEWSVP